MTISSEVRKAGPFNGNGVTTSFPFTFKVFDKGDLRVVRTMPSGMEVDLLLDSDYSVTLNGDQDATPGGTVTYPISGDPLAEAWKLTVIGDIDALQQTDLTNQGGFFPQVIENSFDRLTMLIQQLEEELGRTIRISVSDATTGGLELPAAGSRPDRVLGFDADGNFTTYPLATATLQAAYKSFTATAGQTVFNLPFRYTPGVDAVYVFRNGSKLKSGVDYQETSDLLITLVVGASENDLIEVITGVPLSDNNAALAGVQVRYAATKAAADSLAAGLGDGATVIVDRDETAGGVQTRRVVTSGVLGAPVNELDATMVARAIVVANTVSEMLGLANVNADSTVQTKGYHSPGDGGGAYYAVSSTPRDFAIPLASGLFANPVNLNSPRQIGWTESGGKTNYDLIAEYANKGYTGANYDTIYTLRYFVTQWLAGTSFPIAFYGDSTTDGATTTGHIPSTIAGNDPSDWGAAITITESPNAYPKELERQLKLLIGSSAPVRCYNAGFDSQSLRTGSGQYYEFGNKAFHRVFFGNAGGLNNVDFSDVKGIVLSWGTSDSINLNDINTILDSYEWKMELLITECFERGIQPFIADPVYCNQRRGSLVSGRDNDESVSVIETINNRLRQKFNLEKLSIRVPLETYATSAFPAGNPTDNYGAKGDFGDVITKLPDGVHPNDKGHRMVASYYASVMHPLIKTLTGDDEYKITAGSFYPITEPTRPDTDMWFYVDPNQLITRSTYFWRFSDITTTGAFLYRFFVYCEKPMDLTYDMLAVGLLSRDTGEYCRAVITNEVEGVARIRGLQVDYVNGGRVGSGSHLLLGRLDVGLNSVELISASTTVIGNNAMGFLRAEPYYDKNKLEFDYAESGLTQFRNVYQNIEWLQNSPRRLWSNKVMSRENYAFAAQGSADRRIKFKANTLHQRDILFNAMRNFRDFDTFDLIRIAGTSVQVYKVVSDVAGVETETLVGSATSSVDFSTIQDGIFVINIQPNPGDITLYIQRVNNPVGLLNTIVGPVVMTGSSISNGGYSFGMQKTLLDDAPIIVNDITDEFEH